MPSESRDLLAWGLAGSNLFLETEFVSKLGTLLATRHPRSAEEPQVWLAHLAAVEGETVGKLQNLEIKEEYRLLCRNLSVLIQAAEQSVGSGGSG